MVIREQYEQQQNTKQNSILINVEWNSKEQYIQHVEKKGERNNTVYEQT